MVMSRQAPTRIEGQTHNASEILMSLIERATTDETFSVEKLSQLLDVKERWDAEEARKSYVAALAAFKRSPPRIVKEREVSFKNVHYSYATLGQAASAIAESLAEHGLSHGWSVAQSGTDITVTCTLTHEQGHKESTSITAPPDDSSDGKNSIQRIGSAVSYLERYTLLAITGLAAGDQDDDGYGGAPAHPQQKKRETPPGSRSPGGAPARGARCPRHDKLWGKHPSTGTRPILTAPATGVFSMARPGRPALRRPPTTRPRCRWTVLRISCSVRTSLGLICSVSLAWSTGTSGRPSSRAILRLTARRLRLSRHGVGTRRTRNTVLGAARYAVGPRTSSASYCVRTAWSKRSHSRARSRPRRSRTPISGFVMPRTNWTRPWRPRSQTANRRTMPF